MYRPVLIAAPTIMPVTLADVKAWSDITYADKDSVLNLLIAAETSRLDGFGGELGRCLCEQTWAQDFDGFERCFRLPLAPVMSITSVKYIDDLGAEQTVSTSFYDLLVDQIGPYVKFRDTYSYPSLNSVLPPVRVTYLAGYPTADDEWSGPADIKAYIAARVRARFDNPDQEPSSMLDGMIDRYRRVRF